MSAVQALFREYIGISPQTLSRVIRFQYALWIPSQGYRSLAELAAINGYRDQAHMNRDFRAPAGRTPGQLRPFADRATLAGASATTAASPTSSPATPISLVDTRRPVHHFQGADPPGT
ncbi:helix-turn-helix domain-containing protein [Streptomyces sp. BE308]|uniref:helix-turn-helix domain-containing protein n=1 Tax=Streptomyces sp. BE308 TaxID=3002529 RepID=UPI002E782FFD|nr:helix-turn-helix domain-containing protein [Streptomyces sp. BE308]MEE1792735.1 helix-turn-helix domain-containing protein [Streptomyces sp. BE308]